MRCGVRALLVGVLARWPERRTDRNADSLRAPSRARTRGRVVFQLSGMMTAGRWPARRFAGVHRGGQRVWPRRCAIGLWGWRLADLFELFFECGLSLCGER